MARGTSAYKGAVPTYLLWRLSISCSENRHEGHHIVGEWIAQTDVPADERVRGVAGLRLDPPGRRARRRGAGHEASAQRMSRVPRQIEADRLDPLLHDGPDRVAGELTGQHLPAPGDRPEHRSFGDPGQLEPLVERPYRADRASAVVNSNVPSLAFLVGLAFRNGDDDAAGRSLDRFAIDAAEFRAPEAPANPTSSRARSR